MFVPEGVLNHLAGFSNNIWEFCKEEEFEKNINLYYNLQMKMYSYLSPRI